MHGRRAEYHIGPRDAGQRREIAAADHVVPDGHGGGNSGWQRAGLHGLSPEEKGFAAGQECRGDWLQKLRGCWPVAVCASAGSVWPPESVPSTAVLNRQKTGNRSASHPPANAPPVPAAVC